MTFENSVTLGRMRDEAQKKFRQTEEYIADIDTTLDGRLGGKTRGGLIGGLVVSVIWLAVYIFAYVKLADRMPQELALAAVGVSAVMMLLVFAGDYIQLRYYGAILAVRGRLTDLKRRLSLGQTSLESNLRAFLDAREKQWDLPLAVGPSIEEETRRIEAQLSGMEALRHGAISKAGTFFYYVTGIVWTVAGSFAISSEVMPYLLREGLPANVAQVGIWVVIGIAAMIQFLAAKAIWGKTDCEVTNATLFATVLGPVVALALIAAACLVVVIVQLVISILVFVVAGMCVIGSLSGG